MSDPVGSQLYDAAYNGSVSELSSLLRNHPEINVNWTNVSEETPLHAASSYGSVEGVKLLLAHPDINVNLKNSNGKTPFSFGCEYGRVPVVRLLLKDPRVDVTLEDDWGGTPLWYASWYGEGEVIEWLVASGRDLGDVKNKNGKYWDGEEYTTLEIARKNCKTEVVSVLERFMANPEHTRHELRVKLGVVDEQAAEGFALTVFLCDGLLQLKPALTTTTTASAATDASRFFGIASKLPMELQMILCHRAVCSMKQNILQRDSECSCWGLVHVRQEQGFAFFCFLFFP